MRPRPRAFSEISCSFQSAGVFDFSSPNSMTTPLLSSFLSSALDGLTGEATSSAPQPSSNTHQACLMVVLHRVGGNVDGCHATGKGFGLQSNAERVSIDLVIAPESPACRASTNR